MSQAGDGLVVVLDALHRLILKYKQWALYKVSIKDNWTKEKHQKLVDAKKKFVVVEDKKGKKFIGEWKPMKTTYEYHQLGVAISDWLADAMLDKFPANSKLSVDDIVKYFKSLEKQLTKLSALSSMLTFRIKMDMLTDEELRKIDEEMKRNSIKDKGEGVGRRQTINIGPEVVLVPVVINEIMKDKKFEVVDCSKVDGPQILRGYSPRSEVIKANDLILPELEKKGPFGRPLKDNKKHKKAKLSNDKKKHKKAKLV